MLHKKTVVIPEKTEEKVYFIECDLCGKMKEEGGWGGENWSTKAYEILEVSIRMKTGESYPEGGYSEEIQYHVCPECFKDKLMVWMKKQGAAATESKWHH